MRRRPTLKGLIVRAALLLVLAVPFRPHGPGLAEASIVDVREYNGRPIVHVDGEPFFPIGVTYHFTRRLSSWDRDLAMMREIGINTVRADFGWRDVVPIWEGNYHFGVLDRFLDTAERHGLKVVFVLSHATGDVNIPAWFALRYHNWGTIRDDGKWIRSAQPSVYYPHYRRLLTDYIRETVRHIRGHPALLAYQILNEPSYHPEYLADYNPYTIEAFRDWLPDRYSGIDELNKKWDMEFESFAVVEPPGRAYALAPPGGLEHAWHDWREFSYESLARFIEMLEQAVRAEDPNHPVMVAEMSWWWWGQQPYTGVSPWHVYRAADIVGYDVYPEEQSHAVYYALNSDMLARYWQKPVWVTELNRKDGRPSVDDLDAFARAAVSYGASGIFYFAWNDDWLDGGNYGLIDIFGRPKPQFQAFARTVAWLDSNTPQMLAGNPPEPDVVFVWPTDAIANSEGHVSPAWELFQLASEAVHNGLRIGIVEQSQVASVESTTRVIELGKD